MPPGDSLIHDTYGALLSPWPVVVISFLLGAVLGSFINVVAYRMPRGMSLSHPGSRCPACGHSIRWHDNFPVAGWFLLGGRCRDCHARISVRYPLGEAAVAVTSALLGWVAMRELAPLPGGAGVFVFDIGVYAYHLLLMCTLISVALMELDGHLPPPRLLAGVLVVGFALGGILPDLRPHAAVATGDLGGVYEGAAGLMAAILLAALAWPAWVEQARRSDVLNGAAHTAELALVGLFLGARDIAVIAPLGLALDDALRVASGIWPSLGRLGWAAPLAIVTLADIVAGPELEAHLPFVAGQPDLTLLLMAGVGVALLGLGARVIGRPAPRARTAKEER